MKYNVDDAHITFTVSLEELGVITNALGRIDDNYDLFMAFQSLLTRVNNL